MITKAEYKMFTEALLANSAEEFGQALGRGLEAIKNETWNDALDAVEDHLLAQISDPFNTVDFIRALRRRE